MRRPNVGGEHFVQSRRPPEQVRKGAPQARQIFRWYGRLTSRALSSSTSSAGSFIASERSLRGTASGAGPAPLPSTSHLHVLAGRGREVGPRGPGHRVRDPVLLV